MFGGDTIINITQIIGWYALNVGIFRKKHVLEIKCRFIFADTDMKLGSVWLLVLSGWLVFLDRIDDLNSEITFNKMALYSLSRAHVIIDQHTLGRYV